MIYPLIYAYLATIGFSYIFNAPKKAIFLIGFIGTLGWLSYSGIVILNDSKILGSFIGAFVVTTSSELSARRFKMPATIFLIPGIIPLVPGSGLYYTMLLFIQKNDASAIRVGTETVFIAGAIAIAIATSASFFKKRNDKNIKSNLKL